ncbi:MAG: LacI family DNA-binding transcriptional regulator [Anaerolineae bacterium]
MPATIYDVAKRAGVSIATVSRVLNESARVKKETRAQVLEAIEALGYQPKAAARGLATNRTEVIGIVFPNVAGPFFTEIVRGVQREARKYSYHLLIYSVDRRERSDRLMRVLTNRVDGLIVTSLSVERRHVADLLEREIPFVITGWQPDADRVNSVLPDNRQGVRLMVDHLVAHGYQRIGLIAGPRNMRHGRERYSAYREAIRTHGLRWDSRYVVRGDFEAESGRRAMQELLALPKPPDVVFACSDLMAIGAIQTIQSHGLSVPDDIAVVGFDDIEQAARANPPLTTIRQAINEMGVEAVRLLMQCINDPQRTPETIVLPTSLVIRRSCGCTPEGLPQNSVSARPS